MQGEGGGARGEHGAKAASMDHTVSSAKSIPNISETTVCHSLRKGFVSHLLMI